MPTSTIARAAAAAGRVALPAAGLVWVAGAVLNAVLVYKMARSLRRYGTGVEGRDLDWMA